MKRALAGERPEQIDDRLEAELSDINVTDGELLEVQVEYCAPLDLSKRHIVHRVGTKLGNQKRNLGREKAQRLTDTLVAGCDRKGRGRNYAERRKNAKALR